MTNDNNEKNIERMKDANLLPPLVLAYLGDSVFELYIRERLIFSGCRNVHNLHKKAITFVKAKAQSHMIHELIPNLTEKEQGIVRRGRNANPHSVPKNADISDYRYATGFETLIGYLYLTNQDERMKDIMNSAYGLIEKEYVQNE